MNVRQVVTGEEIRFDPNGEDNRRGLGGAAALYHIVGAACAAGKSLDEVAEIAERYAANMATLAVQVACATHPQNGMSFGDLGETDMMEIGAGQHGEGGGIRVPMMTDRVIKSARYWERKAEIDAFNAKSRYIKRIANLYLRFVGKNEVYSILREVMIADCINSV